MIWLAVALCLLVSFVFSGIEAGILSVNRVRLKHRVKQRDRAARRLNRLLEQPERLLVTVLLVTNLMNIFAITLTTQEFVARCGAWGYLLAHADLLDARSSSIYRKRPRFSVFGVGPYTFAPWKVGISGFYKTLDFRAIGPVDQANIVQLNGTIVLGFHL